MSEGRVEVCCLSLRRLSACICLSNEEVRLREMIAFKFKGCSLCSLKG